MPEMSWTVRDMCEADATAIGPVHLKAWHETYRSIEHGIDAEWIDQHVGHVASAASVDLRLGILAAAHRRPDRTLYRVLDSGGAVAGFVHAQAQSDDWVTLEALYLLDRLKGTGAADAMMRTVLDWSEHSPMRLEVATYNERAIRFYRRYGFSLVGARSLWCGRVPVQMMRRALPKPDTRSASAPARPPRTAAPRSLRR